MGSGIHVGIDLGTSNSAIALYDGDAVTVVAGAGGELLTPSVVRIDARGGRSVGRRAVPGLDGDPANTRGAWKRLMGTGERLSFEAPVPAELRRSSHTTPSVPDPVRNAGPTQATTYIWAIEL